MPIQPFKKQKQLAEDLTLEKKAVMLYKQGLTTREVGEAIGRSHQWVALRVKKLLTTTAIDTDLQSDKLNIAKRKKGKFFDKLLQK